MRQLIETKKNVIVMAENNGGAVAHWYNSAYDRLLQDTPYGFKSVDEMAHPGSCAIKRGKRSAPLLMINHWLDTGGLAPKSLADEVNSTDVLLERAEVCAQRRGQIPNDRRRRLLQRGRPPSRDQSAEPRRRARDGAGDGDRPALVARRARTP